MAQDRDVWPVWRRDGLANQERNWQEKAPRWASWAMWRELAASDAGGRFDREPTATRCPGMGTLPARSRAKQPALGGNLPSRRMVFQRPVRRWHPPPAINPTPFHPPTEVTQQPCGAKRINSSRRDFGRNSRNSPGGRGSRHLAHVASGLDHWTDDPNARRSVTRGLVGKHSGKG